MPPLVALRWTDSLLFFLWLEFIDTSASARLGTFGRTPGLAPPLTYQSWSYVYYWCRLRYAALSTLMLRFLMASDVRLELLAPWIPPGMSLVGLAAATSDYLSSSPPSFYGGVRSSLPALRSFSASCSLCELSRDIFRAKSLLLSALMVLRLAAPLCYM